jgi:hypothetical protein
VVGLPGDRVAIRKSHLWRNGTPFDDWRGTCWPPPVGTRG